ncbi:MAG: radical SAM protein [bacterium]|nr:radical SAM protein [bacterium]
MRISTLQSGGLITNYLCTSQCKHCLYSSSPRRAKDYISGDTAAVLFEKIKEMGCTSVHIGGGEPFLNFNGLKEVLRTSQKVGMGIDYVETNSSWFKNHQQACDLLEELKELHLETLLISISPFHNEFIPFNKVKGVIKSCQAVGIKVFPWIYDFYQDLETFSDSRPHPLSEYVAHFGPNYLKKVFKKYWIHPGGRALTSLPGLYRKKDPWILLKHSMPCCELTNTSHFHFDCYGNYIPGLCSGFQIDYRDLGGDIAEKDYPYLHLLYSKGLDGFYRLASEEFGFIPEEKYASRCHLCLEIRRFLVLEKNMEIKEFGPKQFYEESNL